MDRPAELDDKPYSGNHDRHQQGRTGGVQPRASPSLAETESCPRRKQELPGERVEIPGVSLRIGRNRQISRLHRGVHEERRDQDQQQL